MPVLTRNARQLPRPTLPIELFDQILHDPQLDMFDLARCCRVSQKFMSIARPTLYYSIDVSLLTPYEEDLEDVSLNERGRQLLDSVSASPSLGRLTRRINVEAYYSELRRLQDTLEGSDSEEETAEAQDDFESLAEAYRLLDPFEKDKPEKNAHIFEDPADAIDLFLKAMPLVNSLTMNGDLWRYDSVKGLVVGQGHRWVELDVSRQGISGELLSYESKGDETLKMTRLKRLRCSHGDRTASLPDNLQLLEIGDTSDLSSFHFSPSSQLRVLRVSASEENLSQILTLRYLERLYLKLPGLYSAESSPFHHSKLSAFAKHPHLRFLSIQFVSDTVTDLAALPLLSHLPASVTRLDFPLHIPYDSLFALLRSESIPSLRIIGVSQLFWEYRDNVASTRKLQTLCDEKGLRLEWVDSGYCHRPLF